MFQTVLKSKSFSELGEEALASIFMRDNLDIDEMDVFLAVKEWANVNSVSLHDNANVSCINTFLIDLIFTELIHVIPLQTCFWRDM